MTSGVKPQDDVVDVVCQDMKIGHKHRYVIMGLVNNMKEIGIVKKAPMSATFDDMIQELTDAEEKKSGCYVVFDFAYKTKENQDNSKLVFIKFAPDTLPVKEKMVIASSKDSVRKLLEGIQVDLQASSIDELDYEEIFTKCR